MRPLPDYPWDRLTPYREIAGRHPDGVVDLSIGTPVDPVPDVVRDALAESSDMPGYPTTAGTPALRDAVVNWLTRRCGAPAGIGVLPTIGSKELVAWLPTLLGVAEGDLVAIPRLSYPTYEIGALLAGAEVVRTDEPEDIDDSRLKLVWLNSPSNPTGAVLSQNRLRDLVSWARERGVVVVNDECYVTLGWDVAPTSILDVTVAGDGGEGVLAVHSLSKRSNLAGYRAGFVAGDEALVDRLLKVRKHAGMIVPFPVQGAMVAALSDETHADGQRRRYGDRRRRLAEALRAGGWRIDHSEAGLYLWATRGRDTWDTVAELAEKGILAGPGEFYGPDGSEHVRLALTAPDERVEAAAARLTAA